MTFVIPPGAQPIFAVLNSGPPPTYASDGMGHVLNLEERFAPFQVQIAQLAKNCENVRTAIIDSIKAKKLDVEHRSLLYTIICCVELIAGAVLIVKFAPFLSQNLKSILPKRQNPFFRREMGWMALLKLIAFVSSAFFCFRWPLRVQSQGIQKLERQIANLEKQSLCYDPKQFAHLQQLESRVDTVKNLIYPDKYSHLVKGLEQQLQGEDAQKDFATRQTYVASFLAKSMSVTDAEAFSTMLSQVQICDANAY